MSFGGSKAPQVDTTAPQDLEETKKKAKKSRVALFKTEGGVAGQELQQGEVKKRSTLLGN